MLLVDIGNTRIKWAVRTTGGLRHSGTLLLGDPRLEPLLYQAWKALPPPRSVHLCNVAGESAHVLVERLSRELWQLPCKEARVRAFSCGVRNAYRDPAQLGIDRWLALIAAWNRQHRACCVLDCGTAVTFDLIDAHGRHLGGLIGPGERLMADALDRGTHALASPETRALWLADNTSDAIAAGCLRMLAGFAEQTLEEVRRRHRLEPLPLITGGSAPRLLELLDSRWIHAPDLVLAGLALDAGENIS